MKAQDEKIMKLEKRLDSVQKELTEFKISDNMYKIAISCRAACSMSICTIMNKLNELTNTKIK